MVAAARNYFVAAAATTLVAAFAMSDATACG
jgi:hypothetical protein